MSRKSSPSKMSRSNMDDDELLREFTLEQKRTPKLKSLSLSLINPLTENQKLVFDNYKDNHLILTGSAGTGKTFIAMYLALKEVLEERTCLDKVMIVRSIVPSRDVGFLPGTLGEKMEVYELPYKQICSKLMGRDQSYETLVKRGKIEFISTSFVRGLTFDNCVIIVDELQNMSFQELHSIITRLGDDSKIIFCGDYNQTDLNKKIDKSGFTKFLSVCERLSGWFKIIDFTIDDVVRSGLVRDYLMALDSYDREEAYNQYER